MSKRYDAATKALLEIHPEAWLSLLGRPLRPVRVIDADVSTVTAAADKVLLVEDEVPWLLHVELQASRDDSLVRRTLVYNVLLDYRHRLPVASVIVLLRPEADGPELNGLLQRGLREGSAHLDFRYQLVRVWQLQVDVVLTGSPGTLPLVPLCAVSEDALPAAIARMDRRLSAEVTPAEAGQLWTATRVLMGLRFSEEKASMLLQGVRHMRESVTYQAIVAEGEAKGRAEGKAAEARHLLLRLGRKRLGAIDAKTKAAIEEISSIAQLEDLSERVLDVASWQELLAPGRPRRRNGKGKKNS